MNYMASVAAAVLLVCGVMPEQAGALEAGQTAPAFELSYDGSEVLRSADLAGRALIITCEARGTIHINKPFKDAVLKAFPVKRTPSPALAIVPVVACFGYPWPIKGFCVRGVRDSSRSLNLRLYVDTTGEMFRDYGASADTSTVIITDRSATVRYVKAGRVPDEAIAGLIELIRTLAHVP